MVSTRQKSTSGSEGEAKVVKQGGAQDSPPSPQAYVSNTHVLDLPNECLEKIFSYVEYKHVSQIRQVCKRTNFVCSNILNSTFQKLLTQVAMRFQNIKSKMPRRESARRSHYLACESDIMETVHMRLSLLQMTFGKHIERKHMCFFAGEILDEVFRVLRYVKSAPKLARPYKVTDELFDLSAMAMEYFKERIEPSLPEMCFCPDFLDFPSAVRHINPKSITMPVDGEDFVEAQPIVQRENQRVPVQSQDAQMGKIWCKLKQQSRRHNLMQSQLRKEVRLIKAKITSQENQQNEFISREEYDRNLDEINCKFTSLIQELNKCKTELQYWRSRSPQTSASELTAGSPNNLDTLQASTSQDKPSVSPMELEALAGPSTSGEPSQSPELKNKRKSSTEKSQSNGPPSAKKRNVLKSRTKRL